MPEIITTTVYPKSENKDITCSNLNKNTKHVQKTKCPTGFTYQANVGYQGMCYDGNGEIVTAQKSEQYVCTDESPHGPATSIH